MDEEKTDVSLHPVTRWLLSCGELRRADVEKALRHALLDLQGLTTTKTQTLDFQTILELITCKIMSELVIRGKVKYDPKANRYFVPQKLEK